MKKRLAFCCTAALMLVVLVTPHAFLAPVVGYAVQDRGKPKDSDKAPPKKDKDDGELVTKKKFCDDCKKKHRAVCYSPWQAQRCQVEYNICKDNGCRYAPTEQRQACLEDCADKRDKCPETCLKNKCKEECEGVEEAPPEEE